ncbi:MAG: flippase [Pseudomonadota bacterium]
MDKKETKEQFRRFILGGTIWSAIFKAVNIGFSFLISIVLARLAGPSEYGTYVYALSICGILGIPAAFGFGGLLVREISSYQSKMRWSLMRGLVIFTNIFSLVFSILIFIFAMLIVWFWEDKWTLQEAVTLSIALALLPLNAIKQIWGATLRGLRHILLSQLFSGVVHNFIFLLLVAIVYVFITQKINAILAMEMQLIAAFFSVFFMWFFLNKSYPKSIKSTTSIFETKHWIKNAVPFLLINGMQILYIQTDILMIGMIKGMNDVGLYHIATRGAMIIAIISVAVNIPLAPTIAHLFSQGEFTRLQKIVTLVTRATVLSTLPLVLILLIFGQTLIVFIFGDKFIGAWEAFAILVSAQFIYLLMGPRETLLSMTAYVNYTVIGLMITTILNILLNYVLIPIWGITGAAIATAISGIIGNLFLVYWAVYLSKINPTIFTYKIR